MFKSDLIVPVILIVCLLALAYILSRVFSTEEQAMQPRPNSEIVLDEDRYRDGDELGTATNPDDNAGSGNDLNDYYADENDLDADASDADDYYNEPEPYEPEEDSNTYYEEDSGTATATTSTQRTDIQRGYYHVIAGSFRQKIYAEARVRELKRDGFSDAYVGYTNRGAYAVAVAASFSGLSAARETKNRLAGLGYESFVKGK